MYSKGLLSLILNFILTLTSNLINGLLIRKFSYAFTTHSNSVLFFLLSSTFGFWVHASRRHSVGIFLVINENSGFLRNKLNLRRDFISHLIWCAVYFCTTAEQKKFPFRPLLHFYVFCPLYHLQFHHQIIFSRNDSAYIYVDVVYRYVRWNLFRVIKYRKLTKHHSLQIKKDWKKKKENEMKEKEKGWT